MKEAGEVPRFSGIADPKCKCTPDRLCRRCFPEPLGMYAKHLTQTPERFRGKFHKPWNEAVRINNRQVRGANTDSD